jgi:hypothetical protein
MYVSPRCQVQEVQECQELLWEWEEIQLILDHREFQIAMKLLKES